MDTAQCSAAGVVTFAGVATGNYDLRVDTGRSGWLGGYYVGEPAAHIDIDRAGGSLLAIGAEPVDLGVVALVSGAVVLFTSADPGAPTSFSASCEGCSAGTGVASPIGRETTWPAGSYSIWASDGGRTWEGGRAYGYLRGPASAAEVTTAYLSEASVYVLPAGSSTVFDVSFEPGGTVEMIATGAGGDTFEWELGRIGPTGFESGYQHGSDDGSLNGTLAGTYVAGINRSMSRSANAGGFYAGDGATLEPAASQATPVTVTVGATTIVRPVLAPCATVSGTLVGADLSKLHLVSVYPQGDPGTGRGLWLDPEDGGDFTIAGLWPGKWTVANEIDDFEIGPSGGGR
jgi:hypothetical protein